MLLDNPQNSHQNVRKRPSVCCRRLLYLSIARNVGRDLSNKVAPLGDQDSCEVERLEYDFVLSFIGVGVVCMIGGSS